ncbi:MAG: acetyl-CoA carboxylase biotin carboxyl carrier protein subunit [Syntrophales bacterium]|nr:acetyl-CoA carboxylase biotin carboxyl carrier protein subunit [Syntrophales bacterium]
MSVDILSPMSGTIYEIFVTVGDRLDADEEILVIEAMKLENSIYTPVKGTITEILVEEDQKVKAEQVLVRIEESKEAG